MIHDLSVAVGTQHRTIACHSLIQEPRVVSTFLKGVLMTGSICTLEKMNTLSSYLLSYVSTLMIQILNAKKVYKQLMEFDSEYVQLNSHCMIAATASSTSSSCSLYNSHIPENLLKHMRRLYISIPDYSQIVNVKLMTQGYMETMNLTSQIIMVLTLCETQFYRSPSASISTTSTTQNSFDRNSRMQCLHFILHETMQWRMKVSVLSSSSSSSPKNGDNTTTAKGTTPSVQYREGAIVMNALWTVLQRSLVQDIDQKILSNILKDVFVGETQITALMAFEKEKKQKHGIKCTKIVQKSKNLSKNYHLNDLSLSKLYDLHQALCVQSENENDNHTERARGNSPISSCHQGVLIVGQSSCKSALLEIAAETYQKEHRSTKEKIVVHRILPQSMTMPELYGRLSPETNQWKDGVFTSLVRQRQREHQQSLSSSKRKRRTKRTTWIVMDGRLNSTWCDHLHSVLCSSASLDTPTLQLSSGESLPFVRLQLIVEAEDMAQATPSLLTQFTMIHVPTSILKWNMIYDTWIQTQLQQEQDEIHEEEKRQQRSAKYDSSSNNEPNIKNIKKNRCKNVVSTWDQSICTSVRELFQWLGWTSCRYVESISTTRGVTALHLFHNLMTTFSIYIHHNGSNPEDNDDTTYQYTGTTKEDRKSYLSIIEAIFVYTLLWCMAGALNEKDLKLTYLEFVKTILHSSSAVKNKYSTLYRQLVKTDQWKPPSFFEKGKSYRTLILPLPETTNWYDYIFMLNSHTHHHTRRRNNNTATASKKRNTNSKSKSKSKAEHDSAGQWILWNDYLRQQQQQQQQPPLLLQHQQHIVVPTATTVSITTHLQTLLSHSKKGKRTRMMNPHHTNSVLLIGSTGSGKTTILRSVLHHINHTSTDHVSSSSDQRLLQYPSTRIQNTRSTTTSTLRSMLKQIFVRRSANIYSPSALSSTSSSSSDTESSSSSSSSKMCLFLEDLHLDCQNQNTSAKQQHSHPHELWRDLLTHSRLWDTPTTSKEEKEKKDKEDNEVKEDSTTSISTQNRLMLRKNCTNFTILSTLQSKEGASLNPASSGASLSPRLLRHFLLITVAKPEEKEMYKILTTIMTNHLNLYLNPRLNPHFHQSNGNISSSGTTTIPEALKELCSELPFQIVNATYQMHIYVTENMKPTPYNREHYTFNGLHHVVNVIRSLCQINLHTLHSPPNTADVFGTRKATPAFTPLQQIGRVWCFEMNKVYCNRLICEEERCRVRSVIGENCLDCFDLEKSIDVFPLHGPSSVTKQIPSIPIHTCIDRILCGSRIPNKKEDSSSTQYTEYNPMQLQQDLEQCLQKKMTPTMTPTKSNKKKGRTQNRKNNGSSSSNTNSNTSSSDNVLLVHRLIQHVLSMCRGWKVSGRGVILVGENGCGKSTAIALATRFMGCSIVNLSFHLTRSSSSSSISSSTEIPTTSSKKCKTLLSFKERLYSAVLIALNVNLNMVEERLITKGVVVVVDVCSSSRRKNQSKKETDMFSLLQTYVSNPLQIFLEATAQCSNGDNDEAQDDKKSIEEEEIDSNTKNNKQSRNSTMLLKILLDRERVRLSNDQEQDKVIELSDLHLIQQYLLPRMINNLHLVFKTTPIAIRRHSMLRTWIGSGEMEVDYYLSEWSDEEKQDLASIAMAKVPLETTSQRKKITKYILSCHQAVSDRIHTLQQQQQQKKIHEKKSSGTTSTAATTNDFNEESHALSYTTMTVSTLFHVFKLYRIKLEEKRLFYQRKRGRYEDAVKTLSRSEAAIDDMNKVLQKMLPKIKAIQEETTVLQQNMNERMPMVEKMKSDLEEETRIAEMESQRVSKITAECEAELASAMPLLEKAQNALNTLKKNDIDEVKSFRNPPQGVLVVMEALCIMLKVTPERIPDPQNPSGPKINEWWSVSKRLLGDNSLLMTLSEYDKQNMDPFIVTTMNNQYMNHPLFNEETLTTISVAATGLCLWIRAMVSYDKAWKNVYPKQQSLASSTLLLQKTQEEVDIKRDKYKVIEKDLLQLEKKKKKVETKLLKWTREETMARKKLNHATQLLESVGNERERWSNEVLDSVECENALVGDVLVCVCLLALTSTLSLSLRDEFRLLYTQQLLGHKDYKGVPHTKSLLIQNVTSSTSSKVVKCKKTLLSSVFGSYVQMKEWVLYNRDIFMDDHYTMENLYMSLNSGRKYPCMIDPSNIANAWIRYVHAILPANAFVVVKSSDTNVLCQLCDYCKNGTTVLFENQTQTLSSELVYFLHNQDLLMLQYCQNTSQKTNKAQSTGTTEMKKDFHLYITTPYMTPTIDSCRQKVTIFHLHRTRQGVAERCLNTILSTLQESTAIDTTSSDQNTSLLRQQLTLKSTEMSSLLAHCEEKILLTLQSSTGVSLLDNDDAITLIHDMKKTQDHIGLTQRQLKVQYYECITKVRNRQRPLALSVSTLFMTLYTSLSTLHQNTQHIYLFSLQWFLNILQQTLLEYSALKNGNPANGHHPVSSQSSQRKESDQQIYKLLLQQVLVEMYTEKNIILVKDRLVLPVLLYVNALLTKNVITLQDVRL
jgi:energy-coupling factor transporter ATP-binding protein EcfA2